MLKSVPGLAFGLVLLDMYDIWFDIDIWLDIELADIKGRRQRLRDIYSLSPAETLINLVDDDNTQISKC